MRALDYADSIQYAIQDWLTYIFRLIEDTTTNFARSANRIIRATLMAILISVCFILLADHLSTSKTFEPVATQVTLKLNTIHDALKTKTVKISLWSFLSNIKKLYKIALSRLGGLIPMGGMVSDETLNETMPPSKIWYACSGGDFYPSYVNTTSLKKTGYGIADRINSRRFLINPPGDNMDCLFHALFNLTGTEKDPYWMFKDLYALWKVLHPKTSYAHLDYYSKAIGIPLMDIEEYNIEKINNRLSQKKYARGFLVVSINEDLRMAHVLFVNKCSTRKVSRFSRALMIKAMFSEGTMAQYIQIVTQAFQAECLGTELSQEFAEKRIKELYEYVESHDAGMLVGGPITDAITSVIKSIFSSVTWKRAIYLLTAAALAYQCSRVNVLRDTASQAPASIKGSYYCDDLKTNVRLITQATGSFRTASDILTDIAIAQRPVVEVAVKRQDFDTNSKGDVVAQSQGAQSSVHIRRTNHDTGTSLEETALSSTKFAGHGYSRTIINKEIAKMANICLSSIRGSTTDEINIIVGIGDKFIKTGKMFEYALMKLPAYTRANGGDGDALSEVPYVDHFSKNLFKNSRIIRWKASPYPEHISRDIWPDIDRNIGLKEQGALKMFPVDYVSMFCPEALRIDLSNLKDKVIKSNVRFLICVDGNHVFLAFVVWGKEIQVEHFNEMVGSSQDRAVQLLEDYFKNFFPKSTTRVTKHNIPEMQGKGFVQYVGMNDCCYRTIRNYYSFLLTSDWKQCTSTLINPVQCTRYIWSIIKSYEMSWLASKAKNSMAKNNMLAMAKKLRLKTSDFFLMKDPPTIPLMKDLDVPASVIQPNVVAPEVTPGNPADTEVISEPEVPEVVNTSQTDESAQKSHPAELNSSPKEASPVEVVQPIVNKVDSVIMDKNDPKIKARVSRGIGSTVYYIPVRPALSTYDEIYLSQHEERYTNNFVHSEQTHIRFLPIVKDLVQSEELHS